MEDKDFCRNSFLQHWCKLGDLFDVSYNVNEWVESCIDPREVVA